MPRGIPNKKRVPKARGAHSAAAKPTYELIQVQFVSSGSRCDTEYTYHVDVAKRVKLGDLLVVVNQYGTSVVKVTSKLTAHEKWNLENTKEITLRVAPL